MRERLNKILSNHTGQAMDKIETDTDRDNFLGAEEARDYGLIDEILVSRKGDEE